MSGSTSTRSTNTGGFAGLQGAWRSHGYGLVLEIGPDRYRLYEETRVSCLQASEGSLQELAQFYVDLQVSPRRRTFRVRRATCVTWLRFWRIASLPDSCADPDARADDPIRNFEVFWETFAERYALFGIRGVDWEEVHRACRPAVRADTTQEQLFEVFTEMLRPLGDGHVELRSPFRTFNPGVTSALHRRLAATLGRDPRHEEVSRLLADVRERLPRTVREHYLLDPVHDAANGTMTWGRLGDATGYIALHAMAGQSGQSDRPREDQHEAAAGIERALADLGDLPELVLDVRNNGGGYDGVSLRIAGYFIDRKRLAFTKTPSTRLGYGAQRFAFVEPRARRRYAGRIFLLTSGLTASAAEIFVLCLLKRPRVERIGEATRGELSDMMERRLPNGWTLTLSNELYRASDGELYEDRGIPPHVEIPLPLPSDLAGGRDPMLDYAVRSTSRREGVVGKGRN